MAQWYYTQNGQQAGPVDEAQLSAMVAAGQLAASDMVWKDGMAAWLPVSAVPELSGGAAAQPFAPQQYGASQPPGQPLNYGGYAPAQPYGGGVSYRKDAQNAMICSIVGVVCCVILAIVGLVQGTKAKNNMRASGNMDVEGMATAAIIIGWISIGLTAVGIIIRIGAIATHN